ncbi:ABC transporter permease [Dactylosporangium roseum]|uniref:ABC transporter permease n=1 Tax=Dactylosporangium roseum TaxID=47989 RepID=A0ABY5YYH1_9ACTN|nr:ABC transporter permease [Dactylosporangium roseum]UWZ34444.1 ABC transporter permease [Dactylosporangium roseum]
MNPTTAVSPTPARTPCVVAPTSRELDPVGHARRTRRYTTVLAITTPVVLLAVWQLAAIQEWIDTRFFPAPSRIAATAWTMTQNGTLADDVWTTLRALMIGFALGLFVGVATGVALGLSWIVRAALEPLLSALYTVPKLALLPLLLLIFGLGETPRILLVAIGVFFIIWISVVEAILDIPEGYKEAAESFGVRGWMCFTNVTLPAILPQIATGIRLAIGNAVLIIVGIEFVNGDSGIGYRIWHSWSLFAADQMYVGIITVALLGFLLSFLVQTTARLVIRWTPRNTTR